MIINNLLVMIGNFMDSNNSTLEWMLHWSLPKYSPRNSQVRLINEINVAIKKDLKISFSKREQALVNLQ